MACWLCSKRRQAKALGAEYGNWLAALAKEACA